MRALISGSYAYDNIMVFHDKFKNHILPDKVHILNVSFLVPDMRKEFGGCAGNIAYNLKLLGGDPVPMATVGDDFAPYGEWMSECQISKETIKLVPRTFTGQAFITTDMDDNQITAFHPGAMSMSHQNSVTSIPGVKIAIISPAGKEGMVQHARQCAEQNLPFIFDPGQGLPMFNGDEIKQFIKQATWMVANDYEAELITEKSGLSRGEISNMLDAFIVTKGGTGSVIMTNDRHIEIPAVKVDKAVDPTGCGDAYRAGLLYGLMHKLSWKTTGQIASLLGAIKVAAAGTQNHHFNMDEFAQRYAQEFGELLEI